MRSQRSDVESLRRTCKARKARQRIAWIPREPHAAPDVTVSRRLVSRWPDSGSWWVSASLSAVLADQTRRLSLTERSRLAQLHSAGRRCRAQVREVGARSSNASPNSIRPRALPKSVPSVEVSLIEAPPKLVRPHFRPKAGSRGRIFFDFGIAQLHPPGRRCQPVARREMLQRTADRPSTCRSGRRMATRRRRADRGTRSRDADYGSAAKARSMR